MGNMQGIDRPTFDSFINATIARCEERERDAIAILDGIEARRLEGAKIECADWRDGRAYINDSHYFDDVPEEAWNKLVGGFHVAKKWLVDRRYSTLSFEDALQYRCVLRSLV